MCFKIFVQVQPIGQSVFFFEALNFQVFNEPAGRSSIDMPTSSVSSTCQTFAYEGLTSRGVHELGQSKARPALGRAWVNW